jgi:FixJ family two-component response regulator
MKRHEEMNETKKPVVFIVDDDASVLKSLKRLVRSVDLAVETFTSAMDFLRSPVYDGPCCLVSDIRMPGLSGIDLKKKMTETGKHIPTIFITGYGDIPMSVKAMKQGAEDFLEKPFNDQDLLDTIQHAIGKSRETIRDQSKIVRIQQYEESLTPREREVFHMVVRGMLNKQIAYDLHISEKTVKIHRAQVMKKMQAKSLADLVRMAGKIEH